MGRGGCFGRKPDFLSSLPVAICLRGWAAYAGLHSATLLYAEKVRTQFLSLRQLGRGPYILCRDCRQLSPILAAFSNFSSGLPIRTRGLSFSDSPFSLRSCGLLGFSTVLKIRMFRVA